MAGKRSAKKAEAAAAEAAPAASDRPAKRPRKAAAAKAAAELGHVNERPSEPGAAFVIGTGDCGQLGLGEDVTEKLRPGVVELPSDEKALAVTAGGMHTLCLSTGNKVYSWGVNDEAALGRNAGGEPWSRSGSQDPLEPSDVPRAVRMPPSAGTLVGISAGDSHSAALNDTGHVFAWGTFRDDAGVMGFSASERFTLLPTLVWTPTAPQQQVVEISSGCDHVAARCAGGQVLTWGSGKQGQLGRLGPRMSDRHHTPLEAFTAPAPMHLPLHLRTTPVSLACGWYNTFVVMRDGSVYACGLNNHGQLGLTTPDSCTYAPKRIAALGKVAIVTQVAAGQHHTLALAADGAVHAFGRPTYGRLGLAGVDVNSDAAVREPQALQIDELEGAVAGVAAGDATSGCFSAQMCGLFLCGSNTSSMLAKGADDDDEAQMTRVKRTKAFNEVRVTQLAFGGQHVALLGVPTGAAPAVS